jgi:hypothetical protein
MSKRKINLEETLEKHVKVVEYDKSGLGHFKDLVNGTEVFDIITAMKEAIRQSLELAAENAETEREITSESGVLRQIGIVDKQSILNTINQIE